MAKLSYTDRLGKSDGERQSADRQFAADQKQLQLSSDILATKKSLSEKQQSKEEMLGSESLDFDRLIKLDGEIEGLQSGLDRLVAYQEELFPTAQS